LLPSQGRKAPPSLEVLRRKEAALRDVRDDLVNAVNSPLYRFRIENRYFPVLGEGSADAKIMFIGESPSKLEAERGKPFLGSTGEVLEEMLAAIHLRRQDVFLTNLLLDRPPDNREPTEEEMTFYAPFVDRIIAIIQPAVIATLGRFAMRWLLSRLDLPEKNEKISRIHGKLIKARMDYGEIHILPLYHPAIMLHNPSQRDALRRDFQQLKLFI
jgi:uracil-DNA glycosylase family 4